MTGQRLLTMAAAVGLAFSPAALRAADPANVLGDTPASAANMVLADLHKNNLMEIEMGKLAQDKGQSESVKNYGEMLVKDHEDAQKKVEELANQLDVKLPAKDEVMAGRHEAKMKALESKSGAEFDQAFIQTVNEDHATEIAKLETAKKKVIGQTANLVNEVLPVLKRHQRTARQLARNPAAPSGPQKATQ